MATQRQIAANRRNAEHSTGPRSAQGKSVSRFNAPATPEERALVDVLISAEWDLRRYRLASPNGSQTHPTG